MIDPAFWMVLSNASAIATLLGAGKDLKAALSRPGAWQEEMDRALPQIDLSSLSGEDAILYENLERYLLAKSKELLDGGKLFSREDRENFLRAFYHAYPQYRGDRARVDAELLWYLDRLESFCAKRISLEGSLLYRKTVKVSGQVEGVQRSVNNVQRSLDEVRRSLDGPPVPGQEELERELREAFARERKQNPATGQVELSDALYPHPQSPDLSVPILAEDDPEARPLIAFLRESWRCGKHISLSGIGGIGKSASLLKLPWACPMIYVPLRDLRQNTGGDPVSRYIRDNTVKAQALTDVLHQYIREPWETGQPPRLLLILDGLNELSQEMRDTVLEEIRTVWLKREGVQLLISSRYDASNEFSGQCFLRLYLNGLSPDQISTYLESQRLPCPDPADRILHVIDTPLMLSLYAKSALTKRRYDRIWAPWRKSENAGAVIWNYLCSELCRVQKDDRLNCHLATQWIAPYIAYRMMQEGNFSISELDVADYIEEVLTQYQLQRNERCLPADTRRISLKVKKPVPLKVEYFFTLLTEDLQLFKENDGQLQLMHQHFRDCLAAIYLLRAAGDAPPRALPQAWLDPFTPEVKTFLADLLQTEEVPGQTWERMWSFARQQQEEARKEGLDGGVFIRKMLELYRIAFGTDLSAVDFSGLDLSRVSLSGSRLRGRGHFQKTVLSRDTFFGSGHQMKTCSVSWSPSGKRFLSASHDCTIRIWSEESSVLLRDPAVHSRYIRCAQWSPRREDLIASAGDDLAVVLWWYHPEERQWVPRKLGNCEDWVCSLAWSPDGRWIACGDRSSHITLFSTDGSTPPCAFPSPHHDHVYCAAWPREDSSRFATGSDDGVFCVWSPDRDAPLWQGRVSGNILSVDWIQDGRALLVAAERQIFYCREDGPPEELLSLSKPLSYATVSRRKDGDYLALFYKKSAQGSYSVEIYRCIEEEGRCRPVFWAARETSSQDIFQISCAAWREARLICGTQDGAVCRIDLSFENNDEERITLTRLGDKCPNSIRCSSWSHDGRYLAAGCDDQRIRVWDTETWQCVRILEGHDDSVKCLTWSPKDHRLLSGSDDRTIRVWDLDTGESLVGRGHTGPVNCVYWTRDGLLISGSDDCCLRRWSPDAKPLGEPMRGHKKRVYGVAASPDEQILASGGNDRQLRFWDAASGAPADPIQVDSGHREPIRGLAWSRDDVLFSVSNDDRLLSRRWENILMPPLVFPEAHTDFIYSVTLSPDGKSVITGSTDTDVGFFDIQTRQLLAMGTDHDGFIWNVSAQAPSGHLAASAASDGTIRIWDVSGLQDGTAIRSLQCLEIIPCTDLIGCDFSAAEMDEPLRQLLYSNGGVTRTPGP